MKRPGMKGPGFLFILHPSAFILRISAFILALVVASALNYSASGQSHVKGKRAKRAAVCGNPSVACKTNDTFKPNDLPFRMPANSVIFDTELFYAIILKSVSVTDDNCDVFIPETERLRAQALFPDHKVFTSRCADPENLFYTNVSDKHRIMAVYAGTKLADAKLFLDAVKTTGKFPGAYIRPMRTGFNGT